MIAPSWLAAQPYSLRNPRDPEIPDSSGPVVSDELLAPGGVDAYPTLLATVGQRVIPLAHGSATADQIDQRLATVAATTTS